jgi:hypothetical protein
MSGFKSLTFRCYSLYRQLVGSFIYLNVVGQDIYCLYHSSCQSVHDCTSFSSLYCFSLNPSLCEGHIVSRFVFIFSLVIRLIVY